MPRRPTEVVQVNLRLRERLRRRLEQAARKRDVSLNFEMHSRLEQSFEQQDQRGLDNVRADFELLLERSAKAVHEQNKQGDLLRAAEALLAQVDAPEATVDEIRQAATQVRQVIAMIDAELKLAARRMHTTGGAQS
jgi:uncharacterized protein YecA (UPF0149 family)